MADVVESALVALLSAREQLEGYERDTTGESYNDTQINAAIKSLRARLAELEAGHAGGGVVRVVNDNGKRWRVESADGRWEMKPTGHIDASEAEALCRKVAAALAPSPSAGEPEPIGWQFQLPNGKWSCVLSPREDLEADMAKPTSRIVAIRPAYATPPATPVQPTASVEAVARAICKGKGLNPDSQHQGAASDGTVDGHWSMKTEHFGQPYDNRWHYGWRNQASAAEAVIELIASLTPAPTQGDGPTWGDTSAIQESRSHRGGGR